VDRVLVDHERTCERMQEFASTYMPGLGARVERYSGSRPIFDLHGMEEEIQRSLERKVPLKSGGYLIIDQTEALTTIDVNTGAYVGHRNLEETIYRTNLEAAVAIARQLRLRNLGGIIIIDFIDMEEEEHRKQVLQALEKALAKDHAKTHVSAVSPLGLVEMTRKRTRESLAHQLCAPCPACEGRGFVKTPETVCYEIFREVLRQAGQFDFQQLMVLAHSDIIERLLDEESAALGELEVLVGKPIRLQTEALYLHDQYDVVLM
jgi:ribonuclease G